MLRLATLVASLIVFAFSEEEAAKEDGSEGFSTSPTKNLLEELTINMASEAIDARTFVVRDTASGGKGEKMQIRLGNVKLPEKGDMSDGEYEEKLAEAKSALAAFVDKQMIFWKQAPDELQPAAPTNPGEPKTILADAWTIDGRHITSMLTKAGHVADAEEYKSDLARDILSAEADANKKEQYKKLEEALAKNQEAQQQEEEEEEEQGEPIGLAGWLGLSVLGALVVGALTNFGRGNSNKRTNPNRKKSFFQNILSKLKLA